MTYRMNTLTIAVKCGACGAEGFDVDGAMVTGAKAIDGSLLLICPGCLPVGPDPVRVERLMRACAVSYKSADGLAQLICRACSETGNWPCSLCEVHAAWKDLVEQRYEGRPPR